MILKILATLESKPWGKNVIMVWIVNKKADDKVPQIESVPDI